MKPSAKPKIALVLGTRPEIIKMSPVIRHLEKVKANYFMIHSDQHYSFNMDEVFFKELELPEPHHQLNITSRETPNIIFAQMLTGIEKIFMKEKPRFVLVQGDTNTVLAAALVANRLSYDSHRSNWKIGVGHVEAGLRSRDLRMPEEMNRILSDQMSEVLFAPTQASKKNAIKDGIAASRIVVTGNTVVDAVLQNRKIADRKSRILDKLGVKADQYAIVTLHRPENVDHADRLRGLIDGLDRVSKSTGLPLVFPIHPRTEKFMNDQRIAIPKSMIKTEPVGYLDFLKLTASARIILTDSGGIQEEASILKVPCVTLRENTERPETVWCGGNYLAGVTSAGIVKGAAIMMRKKRTWKHALGDGKTSEHIYKYLVRNA